MLFSVTFATGLFVAPPFAVSSRASRCVCLRLWSLRRSFHPALAQHRSWADYSFSNISAPEVLFDPGYTVIDADIITFANRCGDSERNTARSKHSSALAQRVIHTGRC